MSDDTVENISNDQWLKNFNSSWRSANQKKRTQTSAPTSPTIHAVLGLALWKWDGKRAREKRKCETPFLCQFFQGHCGLSHSHTECHSSAKWIVSLFVQAMGSRKTSLSPWTLPRGQLGQMSSSKHKGDGWPYSGPWSHIINSYKVLWFVNWIS